MFIFQQYAEKQKPVSIEPYTDGTVLLSLSLKGKTTTFLVGGTDYKPYFGLYKEDKPACQLLTGFNWDMVKEISAQKEAYLISFSDGAQLLLKYKEKAFQNFNVAYPIGISVAPYTDNSTAGHLFVGDKSIPIIFLGNTQKYRPLESLEKGTLKLKDLCFDEKSRILTLEGADGTVIKLKVSPEPMKGGFFQLTILESKKGGF